MYAAQQKFRKRTQNLGVTFAGGSFRFLGRGPEIVARLLDLHEKLGLHSLTVVAHL
jgi:hypothetical protein